MKTELTFEESAKLVELGAYPEWAKPYVERGSTPIITLEHILELLPKEFTINSNIAVLVISTSDGKWCTSYEDNIETYAFYINEELIDVLYQLLIWTTENKIYEQR